MPVLGENFLNSHSLYTHGRKCGGNLAGLRKTTEKTVCITDCRICPDLVFFWHTQEHEWKQ
ncbi:hypothetical protein VDG1235_3234 [Verrucomicrobiia bacterium DG1235]|nr:hypothetical protein VDG1235_3234 [Verrucomicrobiae bacterium DG1235]